MLLSAEQLSINFGSRQLLQDVDFYLNEGDKTGVIGINGTGKSTFLKVLAGLVQPDSGHISRRPNLQVSYLPQNPEMDDDWTILEQVFASMPPQFRALNEYEAKAMLTKLGLGETDRRIGTLSGGERRRAALCAALIHPADVLVLDEPTNHLDTEMVAWLEDWLRRYKGGLVMVTHDRYFLERVVNHITELSRGKLYHYEANYSRYLELREQRAQMAEASERKRQSILRVEREWILRGCQARSTKSKERIDRYEALKNQKAPERDSTVQLAAASSRLGKKIITVSHDRFFLDKMADTILEVRPEGRVDIFTGNWSDWARKRRPAEEKKPEKSEKTEKPQPERPREKKLKFSYNEQREFETIDAVLAELEEKLAACRCAQEACGSDYVRLQELTDEQERLSAELDEKTERWVYLNDLKEKIDAQNSQG